MNKVQQQIQIALDEIGAITPEWSEEDGLYVFEHPAYPMVMHADTDPQKTRTGYLRALKGFIEDRMAGQVAEVTERITSGRGGARPGAGRKVGSGKKEPTTTVRVPYDIADWIKDKSHQKLIRTVMMNTNTASLEHA